MSHLNNSGPAEDGGKPPIESDAREAELVNRIIRGDRSALGEMFSIYRPRLWRLVSFRLHPRLQGRLDADDVLQEAWIRAVSRIDRFLGDASHSCFIWFRMIVVQTLIDLQRRHLGAEKRSAGRELSIHRQSESASSSLAFHLVGQLTSPSSTMRHAELARQLDGVLHTMDEIDREVLTLRHFEELTNSETARVLNMSEQAASARYIRALRRLKNVLEVIPGFVDP